MSPGRDPRRPRGSRTTPTRRDRDGPRAGEVTADPGCALASAARYARVLGLAFAIADCSAVLRDRCAERLSLTPVRGCQPLGWKNSRRDLADHRREIARQP